MPIVTVTRRLTFNAAHRVHNPELSDLENARLFGKCNNPNGHGHNYVLEITIEGDPDPVTGMVFDLRELKEIINEEVVDPMDHRFLNHEVPPFDRVVPTTENIARVLWDIFEEKLGGNPKCGLYRIRLYETPDLYVDYWRE